MAQETLDFTLSLIPFLMSTLRVAVPLIFAAYGGLLSERSGIIQIALEGFMLMGALSAAIVTHYTGSPWFGVLAAALTGVLFAGLKGFFVLSLKVDQIIAGTAINLLAFGVAPFVTKVLFDSSGSTPSLPLESRFSVAPIYFAGALTIGISFWYYKTRSGLAVQFAGEAPQALEVAGTSVLKTRWLALLSCGALAAVGGSTLSVYLSSAYSPNMTGGRGFIALAALIFGRWKPLPTLLACLFFGFTDALQIRLQGVSSAVPVQFVQILPYLFTVIALAGFFGQSRPPKALGQTMNRG